MTKEEILTRLDKWFDEAKKEPVSISRKEDHFILLKLEDYLELKESNEDLKTALTTELNTCDFCDVPCDNPECFTKAKDD